MYEPPAVTPQLVASPSARSSGLPPKPNEAHQWDAYNPNAFIPPIDDFVPSPPNVPPPPYGRAYGMYRQPPTWQHASLTGMGAVADQAMSTFFSSGAALVGAALAGYALTGHMRGAAGAGLAAMGMAQVPQIFGTGGLTRLILAAAALGGAYWLLKPDSNWLQTMSLRRNPDDDDDFEDEENDDETLEKGARASASCSDPSKSSPWLKEIK